MMTMMMSQIGFTPVLQVVKYPSSNCCYASSSSSISETQVLNGSPVSARKEIRLGLPSKGRMSSDTLDLLKDCQLSVKQVNPRQYVAQIPQVGNVT
jgi:ATP phosphoribosyltransferase